MKGFQLQQVCDCVADMLSALTASARTASHGLHSCSADEMLTVKIMSV